MTPKTDNDVFLKWLLRLAGAIIVTLATLGYTSIMDEFQELRAAGASRDSLWNRQILWDSLCVRDFQDIDKRITKLEEK